MPSPPLGDALRHLPEIVDAGAPGEVASSLAAAETELYVAAADGNPLPDGPAARRVAVFVGPEGGFTDAEQSEILAAGAHRLSLGDNVLRIETAAVAAVAVIRSKYQTLHST